MIRKIGLAIIALEDSVTDLVQKYIGSEGKNPKINKLGGTEWQKAKAKVRKSINEIAEDMTHVGNEYDTASKLINVTNLVIGEVLELITTSKNRIEPLCPYFYDCGGCHLLHMNYDEQAIGRKKTLNKHQENIVIKLSLHVFKSVG